MRRPEQHDAWPKLTDDQRRWINEVWDDTVIPALEQVDVMRVERDAALLEAQDARAEYGYFLKICQSLLTLPRGLGILIL